MSYQKAMEAAGATIHAFAQFGSYQGEWIAKVSHNNQDGYSIGYYGSCSSCDAFEAEIGCHEDYCGSPHYSFHADCQSCVETKQTYAQRLSDFGKKYLDNILTFEQAMTKATKNLEWDTDAQQMVDWLNNNKF